MEDVYQELTWARVTQWYPVDEAVDYVARLYRPFLDYHGVGGYTRIHCMFPSSTDGQVSGRAAEGIDPTHNAGAICAQLLKVLDAQVDQSRTARLTTLLHFAAGLHVDGDDVDPVRAYLRSEGPRATFGAELGCFVQQSDRLRLHSTLSHERLKQSMEALVRPETTPATPGGKANSSLAENRMKIKKQYELMLLAPLFDALLRRTVANAAEVVVVDVGAGQGYLTRQLHSMGWPRVVGVEHDSNQTEGIEKRNETVAAKAAAASKKSNANVSERQAGSGDDVGEPPERKRRMEGAEETTLTSAPKPSAPTIGVCYFGVDGTTSQPKFEAAVVKAVRNSASGAAAEDSMVTPKQFALVSLHACGSLSHHILRLNRQWQECKDSRCVMTVNVGCCYNLLPSQTANPEDDRGGGKGTGIVRSSTKSVLAKENECCEVSTTDCFPISSRCKTRWGQLNAGEMTHNMKSSSCQAPMRPVTNTVESALNLAKLQKRKSGKPHGKPTEPVGGFGMLQECPGDTIVTSFYRAVIEQIVYSHGITDKSLVARFPHPAKASTEKYASLEEEQKDNIERFVAYANKCLDTLEARLSKVQLQNALGGDDGAADRPQPASVPLSGRWTTERLRAYFVAEWQDKFWLTAAVWALRALAGQVSEGLILVDRCFYLEEANVEGGAGTDAFLLPVFDPAKSPRNFAVVGLSRQ